MKIINKNSEKGFALPLALLLLVVMTIMGATLVNITSSEHNANTNKDSNQQTFYAAESGISVAKSWMVGNISKFSASPPNNLDSQLRFCKASFFPNLRSSNNGYILGLRSFPFKVIWGKNTKYEQKVKKLKYLYSYLETNDFLKIDKVNLTFDKQIVLDYEQNGK